MNYSLLAPALAFYSLFLGCHGDRDAVPATAGIQVLPGEESADQPDTKPRPAAAAGVEQPPCESARLLKVRMMERSESRIGGPVAPTNEDGARPAGLAANTLYYLALDCEGTSYVARVSSGTPGFQPDLLETAAIVHLRAEGGKIFLKADGGTEFEAALATATMSNSPPGQ